MAKKVDPVAVQKVKGTFLPASEVEYTRRDSILYNIGIGATELPFVYENASGFSVIPSYAAVLNQKRTSFDTVLFGADLFKNLPVPINPAMIVHGEQYIELLKPLPTAGKFKINTKVLNFFDKGKGALIELEETVFDTDGTPLCRAVGGCFVRGLGGFGGERGPSRDKENLPPQRAPDAVVEEQPSVNQAHIYRLSGDYNPLHIDPDMATMVGFKKPILHGLCTFGYACRAILKTFCDNDTTKLKSLRVRFASPLIPGDAIVTEMWKESPTTIIFQTKSKASGQAVLANAVATIVSGSDAPAAPVAAPSASSSSGPALKSAVVFTTMNNVVKGNPALLKKVNAVYQFNLKAADGTTVTYTLDAKNAATAGVHQGKVGSPDCTITMTDDDYFSMATGALNPMTAFASGKLSVEGNIMLAQKLNQITEQAKL